MTRCVNVYNIFPETIIIKGLEKEEWRVHAHESIQISVNDLTIYEFTTLDTNSTVHEPQMGHLLNADIILRPISTQPTIDAPPIKPTPLRLSPLHDLAFEKKPPPPEEEEERPATPVAGNPLFWALTCCVSFLCVKQAAVGAGLFIL